MKLELEIKQKSFKSEYHKLAVNLVYTGNWVGAKSSYQLKQHKLTLQQYNLLRILRGQYPNPATVNLLIERMLDKMSNASRIVDRLLAKKLVERKTCSDDRRCVDVIITQKGLQLLEKIDTLEKGWLSQFKDLSSKEALELNRLLDKLRG
ncbi:MAG: MarR family transcriptional regulator [Ignavibacteria bacterium]